MKKTLIFTLALFTSISIFAQAESTKSETKDVAVATQSSTPPDVNKLFEFKNDAFDFGKIPAGKAAKYDLFIKNVSKETAELTLVQPGCGCTTPEY